jgi:tripartite-type tricarboxylate transporter receptor subunit TctC
MYRQMACTLLRRIKLTHGPNLTRGRPKGIPLLGDTLPDYEASAWFGIGVPKSTPAELIERLNKKVNISIADPKFKARLAKAGVIPADVP